MKAFIFDIQNINILQSVIIELIFAHPKNSNLHFFFLDISEQVIGYLSKIWMSLMNGSQNIINIPTYHHELSDLSQAYYNHITIMTNKVRNASKNLHTVLSYVQKTNEYQTNVVNVILSDVRGDNFLIDSISNSILSINDGNNFIPEIQHVSVYK